MRTPDSNYVSSVLATAEEPCVSIYVPTHRNTSANSSGNGATDPNQFRVLADRAEEILTKSNPALARDLGQRFKQLRDDHDFWNQTQGGVVVLASPSRFDAFTLPRTVPERVEVGESFHVKPLLRFVQSADPFHVLGVSRERVALFHGNRYQMQLLKVPGIPLTLTDALGTETDEPVRRFHTAGPAQQVRPGTQGGHGALIAHGQGSRKEEILPDIHRFFRAVDREVIHRVSEPSGLPLILAGTDDNVAEYRNVTKNRFLSADAVHGDWTNWTLPEIREKAWKVFEKHYLARLAQIREDFGTAVAHGKGTADLAEAAKAAAEGRVGTLLIDADRTIPGMLDMKSGVLYPAPASAEAGDMLDDLAELAMRTKAQVIVTPSDQMPTKTGLAAIYRY